MKLSTVLALGATGMAATAAAVWLKTTPAHGSGRSPDPAPAAALLAAPTPRPAAALVVERAHFTAGKTLMVEGRLGHPVLPADQDSETFLYVDISADAAARTTAPAPLDLAIVIDRSGSMKGRRLDNAMAATKAAIGRLHDGDLVSVVTYDTRAEITVEPTVIDATSRARVLQQLARPRAGGDTCISCGVETAMRLVPARPGRVSRILLLSDGFATAGVRDLGGFKTIAENCRRMGASITTIGVDIDYDERILAALSRESNGNHFFVRDPSGLATIFERETDALARTVAGAAELTIDLAPGVFVDQVFDRVTTSTGSQVVMPMGAFTAGEHKTALVRLRVPRGGAGDRPIAAVRLRYDDLVEQRPGACEGLLAAVATADTSQLSPLDGLVSARVTRSETAAALESANQLIRAGDLAQATTMLRERHALNEVALRQARSAMPMAARGKLDADFDRQQAALDQAEQVFAPAATAPAGDGGGGAVPPTARPDVGAQMRTSQADAVDFGR